jgi:hypothetical protein
LPDWELVVLIFKGLKHELSEVRGVGFRAFEYRACRQEGGLRMYENFIGFECRKSAERQNTGVSFAARGEPVAHLPGAGSGHSPRGGQSPREFRVRGKEGFRFEGECFGRFKGSEIQECIRTRKVNV